MNFRIKEKLMLWIFGSKKNISNAGSWKEDDLCRVFF